MSSERFTEEFFGILNKQPLEMQARVTGKWQLRSGLVINYRLPIPDKVIVCPKHKQLNLSTQIFLKELLIISESTRVIYLFL